MMTISWNWIAVALIATILLAPFAAILFGVGKGRRNVNRRERRNDEENKELRQLLDGIRTMQQRIESLETILNDKGSEQ